LAILEAREAGCAILATAVDGIPEALEHGRCGILVPPQNSTALAAGMIHVLRDRSLREALQREAKIGLERFTVSRMTDEVSDIYSDIFDESRVAQSVSA
jgi:glycosyltransferase involved in cell wall biosynthesis